MSEQPHNNDKKPSHFEFSKGGLIRAFDDAVKKVSRKPMRTAILALTLGISTPFMTDTNIAPPFHHTAHLQSIIAFSTEQ